MTYYIAYPHGQKQRGYAHFAMTDTSSIEDARTYGALLCGGYHPDYITIEKVPYSPQEHLAILQSMIPHRNPGE